MAEPLDTEVFRTLRVSFEIPLQGDVTKKLKGLTALRRLTEPGADIRPICEYIVYDADGREVLQISEQDMPDAKIAKLFSD